MGLFNRQVLEPINKQALEPKETLLGYEVLGYVVRNDTIRMPDGFIAENHPRTPFVEIEGFGPGAGAHVLGMIGEGQHAGKYVIRVYDKGDPVMIVGPDQITSSEVPLDQIVFEQPK